MIKFERMVGVINPASTNALEALPQLEAIKSAHPDVPYQELETDRNFNEFRRALTHMSAPRVLVVVVGGDGSNGASGDVLCDTGGILMPLSGGNGNDIEAGLFGRDNPLSPVERLQYGEAVDIHPIDVAINGIHRRAINYFGLGATGRGAKVMESDWYRNLPGHEVKLTQGLYEWVVLPTTSILTRPFPLWEHGQRRSVTDLTVANGPSMAKYGRLPVQLYHPEAVVLECTTPPSLLPWALRMVRGTLDGSRISEGNERHFYIGQRLIDTDIIGHIDAQVLPVAPGSRLDIGIARESFSAVHASRYAKERAQA